MKPIGFPEQTGILAESQPAYQNLPVWQAPGDTNGVTISCWQLSWRERFKILWTGRMWLSQMTFQNPLQSILPSVAKLPIQRDD